MTTCKLCEYLTGSTDQCDFNYEELCTECSELVSLEEEDDIPA